MSSPEDTIASEQEADPWRRLRGALKDVFAELEGGEAYLHAERSAFPDQDNLSSPKSAG